MGEKWVRAEVRHGETRCGGEALRYRILLALVLMFVLPSIAPAQGEWLGRAPTAAVSRRRPGPPTNRWAGWMPSVTGQHGPDAGVIQRSADGIGKTRNLTMSSASRTAR